MRSVLLMLLLSITRAQRWPRLLSCPASCVVCSEHALICHQLSNIIEAPDSTQALMLTDGSISSVDQRSLSHLANLTVLDLSHNAIVTVSHLAFGNLSLLHTLLLDHNRLTNQALGGGAVSDLARLEVLDLGSNDLTQVNGSWFQGTRTLRILRLEGNLLSSLEDDTFSQVDLRGLETLDLSHNLLSHLGRGSFHGLVSLRSLDLSGNRLRSVPAQTFSYLSWLGSLNLDLNTWNCTCELRQLATFLSSYMQAPDKLLYNAGRLVCVSADNPAVTRVLDLTEANCVPPNQNQNIMVQLEARSSISAQHYVRDLAIAAAACFSGGVGLILLVLLVLFRKGVLMRSPKGGAKKEKGAEPGQTVTQRDVGGTKEGLDTKLMLANSNHPQGNHAPWSREAAMLEDNGGHLRSRMGDGSGHFRCPNCRTLGEESGGGDGHKGAFPHTLRQGGAWPNGTEEREERSRYMTHPVRSQLADVRGERSSVRPAGGQASHPISRQQEEAYHHRDPSASRPPLEGAQRQAVGHGRRGGEGKARGGHTDTGDRGRGGYPPGGETAGPGPGLDTPTLSCGNCHRAFEYRRTGQTGREGRYPPSATETALYSGYPNTHPQHRLNTGWNLNPNPYDTDGYGAARGRGVARSVSFYLERPGARLRDQLRKKDSGGGREDDTEASGKTEGGEQRPGGEGAGGTGRTRRTSDGARDENSRRQRPKVQSSRLLKVKLILNPLRKGKVHPKAGSKGSRKEGKGGGSKHKSKQSSAKRSKRKDEEEEEDEEEESTKSKSSSKQKKACSKPQREGEAGVEGEHTLNDNTANQSDLAGSSAFGQQMGAYANVPGRGLPHPGLQGNIQRSSSQPLLFPGAGVRGLPWQTGSLQNLQAPNMPYTGPLQPQSGSLGPPSLLTSRPHPSAVLAPNLAHTSPLHPGQPGSLPVGNSVIQPFSQPPPGNLNQGPRLGSTLTQAAGLQAGQGYPPLAPQAPGFQSLQAPGPLNRENVSNNHSLTLALAPRSAAPQSAAPQSTAPQSAAPQSAAPQSTPHQSAAPQSTAPQTEAPAFMQEYLPSKRRIRLVLPEQTNNRPPTALDKKIR